MVVKFQYDDEGKGIFGHIYRPVAKVTFKSPRTNILADVWMVVDTGADYSILPRHIAGKLRISLEKDCVREVTFGVGGNQTVFFLKTKIKAVIGKSERNVPIAFFDTDEVPPLLGRLGFLETFDAEFLKSHTVVFKN